MLPVDMEMTDQIIQVKRNPRKPGTAVNSMGEVMDKKLKPCTIMEEPRPIKSIGFEGKGSSGWHVDEGYTIEPYGEYGEMAIVTWICVSKDGETVARVPAHLVVICY